MKQLYAIIEFKGKKIIPLQIYDKNNPCGRLLTFSSLKKADKYAYDHEKAQETNCRVISLNSIID